MIQEKAIDLVVSVLAFNPQYQQATRGVSYSGIINTIISQAEHPAVRRSGIRPHKFHGDSPLLENAIMLMHQSGLTFWNDDTLYWKSPSSPKNYFEQVIQPKLSEEELADLKDFSS